MTLSLLPDTIQYPESDGQPISDHTLQFEWIMTIKENLEALFVDDPGIFVAGDLLWYPVEGDPKTRIAPDAMVVFGRPKGNRGSYRQWEEGGITPQVVFEVLSPGNRFGEMFSKYLFYQKQGVEEYYLYDPFRLEFNVWQRDTASGELRRQDGVTEWRSSRLGVRFVWGDERELEIYRPDGARFLTFVQLSQRAEQAEAQARDAQRQAQEALQRAAKLAERLRELGIDPDTI